MNRFFVLVVLLTIITGLSAKTKQLNNFTEIIDNLMQGEQVRVVIHYGDCVLMIDGEETSSPDAVGGMNIDAFEYFAPGSVGNEMAYVVFSKTKLINLGGYVYNYAKLRVFADGKVEITAQYTDPRTFEISMDETFISEINDNENEGAVFFFLLK